MELSSLEIGEAIGVKSIQSPLTTEALSVVRNELATPHEGSVGGRFRVMRNPPDHIPVYEPNFPIEGLDPDVLAAGLEKRYPEIVESMHSGHQGVILDKIAEGLDENKKIVVNMNHASLLRAGSAFRGLCKALEDIGMDNFESAAIIGIMLTQLETRLSAGDEGDDYVPAAVAAGLMSDHSINTVPSTDRVDSSSIMQYKKEVIAHQQLAKAVLKELTGREKGMLILIISSGTHDTITSAEDGEKPKLTIGKVRAGTTKLIRENGLHVVQMGVRDIPGQAFDAQLLEAPELLSDKKQMDRKMARTARFLGEGVSDVLVQYKDLVLP